jgi:hypothetical protein
MKYILILAVVLTSCYSKNQAHVRSKTDTAHVSVIYAVDSEWKKDSAFRVIKDTFRLSGVDTAKGNAKMAWYKDTVYFLPFKDSVTKQVNWYGLPPIFVQEVHITPLITRPKK